MDPSGSARPAAEDDVEGLMLTPGAAFAAVGANGLFVSMPPTLAQFKPVIESRSGLDIVLPTYRVAVIDAWAARPPL